MTIVNVSDVWKTSHPGAAAGVLVLRNLANLDFHTCHF